MNNLPNNLTHSNFIPQQNVYSLHMKDWNLRKSKIEISSNFHRNIRLSDNSDAHFYRFIYIPYFFLCCSECWLTGSVKWSKMYCWYTPRTINQLCFHYANGWRTSRWQKLWFFSLQECCVFWKKNILRFWVIKRCKLN